MILLLQPMTMGTASAQSIPDWVKTNADWWAQGLISDKDFAVGLGFLVKENIIKVDNVSVDPNGDIEISDDIKLPDWIQNNARWWVDGAIGDDDFKSGIQHMVKEDIISFKDKPKILKLNVDSDLALAVFETAKHNEIAISHLLQIKNVEHKIAKDTCEKSVKDYSDDSNFVTMEYMKQWCNFESEMEDIVLETVQIYEIGGQMAEDAEDYAISMGVSNSDIESIAIQQGSKFNLIETKTESEIKSAYKDVQKEAKKANEGLQKTLNSIASNSPEFQKLSFTDKNYVSEVINGIEYSDFRVVTKDSTSHNELIFDHLPHLSSPLDYTESSFGLGHILLGKYEEEQEKIKKAQENHDRLTEQRDKSQKSDESESGLVIIFSGSLNEGDNILESNTGKVLPDDGWIHEWDYLSSTITLPNGDKVTTVQKITKGILEKVISKEIVEGHQLITEGFSMSTLILNEDVTPYHGPLGYLGISEDGLITHPDGTTELTEAGDTTITYPDGTVEIIRENGDYEKHSPTGDVKRHYSDADGASYTEYSDGRIVTKDSDGMITIDYPNGSAEVIFPNDDVYFYPAGQDYMEMHRPDGTVEKHYFTGTVDKDGNPLDGFIEIHHPNGSISKKFGFGGEFITKHSDGRISTFYPDGTQLIMHPDGTSELLRLDGTYQITRFDGVIEVGLLDGTIVKLFSDDLIKQVKETEGPESNTGFTDSGEVYVGTPFVTYGTGIWYMIIGNERHEFDTRDAALAAIDELVEKFKNSRSSQPASESTSDTNSNMTTIPVFMFQNDAFPAYQFLVDPADGNCAGQHLSPYNQDVVYAINFNDVPGMEWDLYPKRGCGFGILDSENIRYIENYEITDKQASDYTKRFGISPDRPLRTR